MNNKLERRLHKEIVIVGAGPAGIASADVASKSGADCLVIDRLPFLGGQIVHVTHPADLVSYGDEKLEDHVSRVNRLIKGSNDRKFEVLSGGFVVDIDKKGDIYVYHENTVKTISYQKLVIASGAREFVNPFPGWTLPGVMTLGSTQRFAITGSFPEGTKIILAGSGPFILPAVSTIINSGLDIVGIVVPYSLMGVVIKGLQVVSGDRNWLRRTLKILRLIIRNPPPFMFQSTISLVSGENGVKKAVVTPISLCRDTNVMKTRELFADIIGISHGLEPNIRVCQKLETKLFFDERYQSRFPEHDENMCTSHPDVYVAGEVTSIGGASKAIVEGEIAGIHAGMKLGYIEESEAKERIRQLNQSRLGYRNQFRSLLRAFPFEQINADRLSPDTVICRCEGTTYRDYEEAIQNGAGSLSELKKRTRAGMGICQGRICERISRDILASKLVTDSSTLDPMRARTPLEPIPLSSFVSTKNVHKNFQ